jgi:hypothetical protein
MMYKIPSEETLVNVIFTVMYQNHTVKSQAELTRLVRKELEKDGKEYKVSEERIRTIAINRHLVEVSIKYLETDVSEFPEVCPVCSNKMTPIMNKTLEGDVREIKRKCTVCPFSVGARKNVPKRYTFTRPKKNFLSTDERLYLLDSAAEHLSEALRLLRRAVNGTALEIVSERNIESMNRMFTDDDGCFTNIRKNILHDSKKQPVWTLPHKSVKNDS